jgi:hypothetical protein
LTHSGTERFFVAVTLSCGFCKANMEGTRNILLPTGGNVP